MYILVKWAPPRRWLDPGEEVAPERAHVEIGVCDGEAEHYVGTAYPVICCTFSATGQVIHPLGAKVYIQNHLFIAINL